MSVEITVPSFGESIVSVVVGSWRKQAGEAVKAGDPLVEVESEKATFDVPAPADGVLVKLLKQTGDVANIGEVIGMIDASATATASASPPVAAPAASATAAPAASPTRTVMPAAARELAEAGLKAADVSATGPGGRLLKEDVQRHVAAAEKPAVVAKPAATAMVAATGATPPAVSKSNALRVAAERSERRSPMSPIRRRIAERLLHAQQSAALLTTFNEVDMTAIKTLREEFGEGFQKKNGIKLGFMSFFVKGVVEALQAFPQLNSEIQGQEIVERSYQDIGIAIGGGKGLVVPVIRNAERLTFSEIELAIGEFAKKAQNGTLMPQELQGGTFTISNGGVYGSLLSTPIVNPPQSGVLGMHSIQDRPVALNGQVVIRPMMYLALTYDHRIVDGREAVSFLKRIKDCVENPVRLLLEV